MFSALDAQLAFAVLGSAAFTEDSLGAPLQPLLVRASTSSSSSCPLLLALRDLLVRKGQQQHQASNGGGGAGSSAVSLQHLVGEQLRAYETDLRQAEQQRKPLEIARDKLRAELQRVEALLQGAEADVRKATDGVLVCKALLQSAQTNEDREFDPVAALQHQQQQQQQQQQPSRHHADVANPTTPSIPSAAQRQQENAAVAAASNDDPLNTSSTANNSRSPSSTVYGSFSAQQMASATQNPQAPAAVVAAAAAPAAAASGRSNNHQQQQQPPPAPNTVTIERVCEMLQQSGRAGTDEAYRSQLIPALAVIERRLTRPGAVIDPPTHGALASVIMTPQVVGAMDTTVQVHAFRAVLAMIRKAADPNSSPTAAAAAARGGGVGGGGRTSLLERLEASGLHACCDQNGLRGFITLYGNSDDDDVKAEVLECLGAFVSESGLVEVACGLGAVPPLVHLIANSTSEPVLERALLLFWAMLASGSDRVRDEALRCGAVPALCFLLYTDSHPLLENALIALGYLSRDERAKIALAETGADSGDGSASSSGLEKIVSCLYHPSPSVLVKATGVIWNCATRDGNRTALRELGAIPALLQQLRRPGTSDLAKENISGALWNLTVDQGAKREVADYEGLQLLVTLVRTSTAENVLENASGTLWNCSASMDNRAALRRHGALPLILQLLQHPSLLIQENAAGTIRNLVINDHCKVAMRECGGIEALLEKMRLLWADIVGASSGSGSNNGAQSNTTTTITNILDKLIASLWILTVTPDNRARVQPAFKLLLDFAASPLLVPGTREKVIGTLRHCCSVAEARRPLVQLGAFSVLVEFAASLGLALPTAAVPRVAPQPAQCSVTLRENIAFTLWNLAREDRDLGRRSGALGVATYLLGDDHDSVVEFAAGAVGAIINSSTNEGRNELGDLGGVNKLCNVFLAVAARVARQNSNNNGGGASSNPNSPSSGGGGSNSAAALVVLLHNALHALRYATSANCDRNVQTLLDRTEDVVGHLIGLVDSPVAQQQLGGVGAGAAITADDISREAILLLKNIITAQDVRAAQERDKVAAALAGQLPRIMTAAASAPGENAALLHRAAQALNSIINGQAQQ